MIKLKFNDIKKNDVMMISFPLQGSIRQKKEKYLDSNRTVILTIKKRTVSCYNKASIGKIVSIINASKE